ncbi:MAG: ATP-binding cassette domain-containing protein [Armatimonadetes bacterium]|nr:ATP-binding cassette domain-containing protein [Armatimonadota bacterium]MDW8120895.1 ATP-binding cassette domain-containing protein [Armatimonadota bacterium]
MNSVAVRLQNVWKVFKSYRAQPRSVKEAILSFRRWNPVEVVALRGVTAEIWRGQITGLIGRNGSGKTTLLGVIAGIYEPTEGTVETDGRVVALLGVTGGFHPELTATENLLFAGTVLGLRLSEVRDRLKDIFEFAELNGFEEAPTRTYSQGMLVRLGFSLGIHCDADILLVDEQLQSTDLSFQHKALEALTRYRAQGKAVVLVTHEMFWLERIADRVLWLHQGVLRADGTPEQVIAQYVSQSGAD